MREAHTLRRMANQHDLTGQEVVSMNLMGFTAGTFSLMEQMFVDFMKAQGNELKSEFYIPSVLDTVRKAHSSVPVVMSADQWYGVTYAEDKSVVANKFKELVENGTYPANLWF